jgi:hypothetical protein
VRLSIFLPGKTYGTVEDQRVRPRTDGADMSRVTVETRLILDLQIAVQRHKRGWTDAPTAAINVGKLTYTCVFIRNCRAGFSFYVPLQNEKVLNQCHLLHMLHKPATEPLRSVSEKEATIQLYQTDTTKLISVSNCI